MKAYSQDLRDRVIRAYKQSKLNKMEISKTYNICYDTVRDWIKRYRLTGDYSSKQGVGCGRKVRFSNKQLVLDFIEKNPDANGIEIRNAIDPEMPMSTFYDTMDRFEITYKKRAKIPRKV